MRYLPIWKEAPFLRLVIPFITGIGIQWYTELPAFFSCLLATTAFIVLIVWYHQTSFHYFRHFWIRGVFINILLASIGCLLTVCRDDAFYKNSLVSRYAAGNYVVAKLEEPLSEKNNSYQAQASVLYLISAKTRKPVRGLIMLYFKKQGFSDSILPVCYGDWIIFRKDLQPITFTGNPGGFDYQRYCRWQQIRFSVFLGKKEWSKLPWQTAVFFQQALIHTREKILGIIRRNLSGGQETAMAEALLIGYRSDLDRDLSQAYSNTGVVHIIAISGLHLALIYELIAFCLRPLRSTKSGRWTRIILIVIALWGFSFLSGASPSVLRSAMMFTCLTIGEGFSKKASVYNNLSASAFLLLCYNPYWLWDIGFQLSYAAVLSIVIFMKPIYSFFFFSSRLADFIWKSISVTLAAQVLTVPICIYQFHQFPNYFLPANLIAVPLSSLILVGELLVCGISFFPSVAKWIGLVLSWLIGLLNRFISYMAQLPFSTWNGLEISIAQCCLIYVVIGSLAGWYCYLEKKYLMIALLGILGFGVLRGISFWEAKTQQKIIVYHVPHHTVIDCVNGRKYFAEEDSNVTATRFLRNSCCQPARIMYRTYAAGQLFPLKGIGSFFLWEDKRILVIEHEFKTSRMKQQVSIDCIVLSKSPRISIQSLEKIFKCRQYVFDASNKIQFVKKWEKECAESRIAYHNIADKGAFVMNMD